MQKRRKGRGYGRGVVSAAEEESEELKNRGKGDKPGEGGSWDKGEGGPGVAGAGLGPKGRGLQAQAAARAAQSLLLSTTFSSATGPTELQGGLVIRGEGPGRVGRARSSGHRSGANLGAGVQLSPGAARNGGSHLASAVGMDQPAS
ncbi:hypothetical protein LEMLEM_LOCUS1496 [Lemmus lemmus]